MTSASPLPRGEGQGEGVPGRPGERRRPLDATVWDDDQVLVDEPPTEVGVRLWAEVARALIGPDRPATVAIDCDDPETEVRLRASGFKVTEVDPDEALEPEESVTVEREGRLDDLLEAVLRLPPDSPLGALATAGSAGVDLDLGAGLDVWGPGALDALRRAAGQVGLTLNERPPEE